MYSFLNYKFIGGGGLILLLIAFLFLDFTYDPYSIRSNVKYGNYAQAKEIFIKELTYSDRLPDVLDNIQEYYAYMPQEYTYYVKSSNSRYIRLNEQTASRNIESIESIIQNNPSIKFDPDKYNFLIAYISLLEFNDTRAQTYIPQIKDKEKYNVEMLKSWSDLYLQRFRCCVIDQQPTALLITMS
ncbi:MAG: hypothetical protein MUE33_11725 [Cytophagaceae bacterium]|jgi:hypothetical protein|nr:hypothetical protein [Cytophagaceae bacterium]